MLLGSICWSQALIRGWHGLAHLTVQDLGATFYVIYQPRYLRVFIGFSLILRNSVALGKRRQSIFGDRTRTQNSNRQI